jgi:transaldolase
VKLFLESAALDTIRWALDAGLVDGVYVTPSALDADAFGIEPPAQVETIARLSTASVVVVVGAVAADDLHRNGREFARIADSVVVAVPFVDDGIVALRRLAAEGIRTAATFVVTAAQAVVAAKTGAAHVAVSIDELDAHGHDPSLALREIRAVFDRHGMECEVIAVAAASPRLVTAAFVAGADAVVVTPATLRALMQHPITDRALDRLLGEVSRRPRNRTE